MKNEIKNALLANKIGKQQIGYFNNLSFYDNTILSYLSVNIQLEICFFFKGKQFAKSMLLT